MSQVFEQSIAINAPLVVVERCITDLTLMERWLNPALLCEPVGDVWSTEIGSKSRFMIKIPLLKPTLNNLVVERKPGLVVWQFDGFFQGRDRWECQTIPEGTLLINRFEFDILNPIIKWGFNQVAFWARKDMQAQLTRLKAVAEALTVVGISPG